MAIYHLSVRGGTRAKGSVAARKADYLQRENQYEHQPDRCLHRESGNMPEWAEENPRDYWRAADEYERANGRLYMEVEVALPRELEQEQQIELAREFARDLTEDGNLPYTMAVHEGRGKDGQGDNPHAHMMISERQNDGYERDRDTWFKRANRDEPEHGGAPKTREFHGGQQIEAMRERWERDLNHSLERDGSLERVDQRSLEAQGIDREPTRHMGPGVKAMLDKDHDRDREHDHDHEPERYQEYQQERDEISQTQRELEHVTAEYGRHHQDLTREREHELDRGLDMGY